MEINVVNQFKELQQNLQSLSTRVAKIELDISSLSETSQKEAEPSASSAQHDQLKSSRSRKAPIELQVRERLKCTDPCLLILLYIGFFFLQSRIRGVYKFCYITVFKQRITVRFTQGAIIIRDRMTCTLGSHMAWSDIRGLLCLQPIKTVRWAER